MQTIAVRVEDNSAVRIDHLARHLGVLAAGANITRSECVRVALERGLAALEREIRGGSKEVSRGA